jgi:hypothetical protein
MAVSRKKDFMFLPAVLNSTASYHVLLPNQYILRQYSQGQYRA